MGSTNLDNTINKSMERLKRLWNKLLGRKEVYELNEDELNEYIQKNLVKEDARQYDFNSENTLNRYAILEELNSDPLVVSMSGYCNVDPLWDDSRFIREGDAIIIDSAKGKVPGLVLRLKEEPDIEGMFTAIVVLVDTGEI